MIDSLYNFVKNNYERKYPNASEEDFERDYSAYMKLPVFKANENIYELKTNYNERDTLSDSQAEYLVADSLKPEVH